MMMRLGTRSWFTLAIVVLSSYAVWSAREWPLGTKLFPWIVGIPLLLLSAAQLVIELVQSRSSAARPREDTGDLQVDWQIGARMVALKASIFFAWLLGFFLCIWLLGFFVAVPLYTFLYLKFQAGERWLMSVALTAATFIFFALLFDQILHLPWPRPVLPAAEKLIRSSIPQIDFWN